MESRGGYFRRECGRPEPSGERARSARSRGRVGRHRGIARLATAALLATAISATAASAHHGEPATEQQVSGLEEPGELGADSTGGTLSTDTELTPVGKDGAAAGWQQIAGSLWRADGTITEMATPGPGLDSPTPYDLDFFGLDFLDKTNGFVVGAQCRRDPARPSEPVDPESTAGCERIPVIYRYREHPDKGLIWEESYRASDTDDPGGFVAAVAWLTPDRALAVGGTGTYPRREQELTDEQIAQCRDEALQALREHDPGAPPPPGMPPLNTTALVNWAKNNASDTTAWAQDNAFVYNRALAACEGRVRAENDLESGAGMARAWIFHMDPDSEDPKLRQGFWRELKNEPDPEFTGEDGDEIPDEMRALQAIDVSPRPANCGNNGATECAIAGGMRQLWHFADGEFTEGFGPELNDGAGLVDPGDAVGVRAFRFRVRDIRFRVPWDNSTPDTYAVAVTSGCCAEDRRGDRPALLALDASGWHAFPGGDSGNFNPDSYYALTVQRGDSLRATALRTPGGPAERYVSREPPSRFTQLPFGPLGESCNRDLSGSTASDLNCDTERGAIQRTITPGVGLTWLRAPAPGTTLSSLRLVSADGDSRRFAPTAQGAEQTPDGIADWAVGVLRSSGRGVAYNTAFGANRQSLDSHFAKPQQCVDDGELVPGASGGACSFEAYQRKNASKALYALSSYALNAYRVAGEDILKGDEGIGWAVGDHGAIVTRGGGVAGVEAPPARRGARSISAPMPGGSAFDAHRTEVTDEPGMVPALVPGAVPTEPGFTEAQDLKAHDLGVGFANSAASVVSRK